MLGSDNGVCSISYGKRSGRYGASSMTNTDNALPEVAKRLELLRSNAGWSIAEMARVAGLHKRSMENYFKGHKPSYDALIAMAKAFNVPVDWLCGFEMPTGEHLERVVYEAAFESIHSLARRFRMYQELGKDVFQGGKVYGRDLDEFAGEEAKEVVRRFATMRRFYPASRSEDPREK